MIQMQVPSIPSGPAWAVAIALIFAGLALLLKTGLPLVAALRKNGKNGNMLDALGHASDLADLKAHIDGVSREAREHREKVMENINETRHTLATPLQAAAASLALVEHLLEEIRDRLPSRRGDFS